MIETILCVTCGFLLFIIFILYCMLQNALSNKTVDRLFDLEDALIEQYERPEPNVYTTTTLTYKRKFNRSLFPRHRKYLK